MRLAGGATLAVPRARAWAALQDPAVLRACTPGLVRLEETAPDHFEATLEVGLPALSGRFDGTLRVAERSEPERMRIELAGKGAPGFVQGGADLRLREDGAGTRLDWEADVQVGGQIGRLGQRMLSGVTKEMAGQFFEQFERVAGGAAPAAEAAPPSPLLAALRLAWRMLLRLLGRSRSP